MDAKKFVTAAAERALAQMIIDTAHYDEPDGVKVFERFVRELRATAPTGDVMDRDQSGALEKAYMNTACLLKELIGQATYVMHNHSISADVREAHGSWIEAISCALALIPDDQRGPCWFEPPEPPQ